MELVTDTQETSKETVVNAANNCNADEIEHKATTKQWRRKVCLFEAKLVTNQQNMVLGDERIVVLIIFVAYHSA